jgi:hypothetical protein
LYWWRQIWNTYISSLSDLSSLFSCESNLFLKFGDMIYTPVCGMRVECLTSRLPAWCWQPPYGALHGWKRHRRRQPCAARHVEQNGGCMRSGGAPASTGVCCCRTPPPQRNDVTAGWGVRRTVSRKQATVNAVRRSWSPRE